MPPRRPLPLTGLARTALDAALALDLGARALRDLGPDPRPLLRHLRAQLTLGAGLRQNKAMLFDGKIFLDVFSPHWPSPAFARMLSTYAANAARPDHARDFIVYMTLAITPRCVFRCQHCYALHTLGPRDQLSLVKLLAIVEELLAVGVGVLSLEGGEPLLRFDDLLAILRAVDGRASCFIATTGYGLTAARAVELKRAGLVGAQISLDDYRPERHNAFRGNPKAFAAACAAVGLFAEAGVLPVLAVCATPEIVEADGLYRYLDLARELGAGMVQVLDPMPAGAYLEGTIGEQLLSPAQIARLIAFHVEANTGARWRRHPAVSVRAYLEEGCRYGCGMGGNQHLYIDAAGNVAPCVYLNASAGNLLEEDLPTILRRLRTLFPHPVDGFCPVYQLAPEIAARVREGESLPLPPRHLPALAKALAGRGLPGLYRRVAGAG